VTQLGAWEIGASGTPERMFDDREYLERHLEDWIQRDPSLLGGDIRWVARQLTLPDGTRLDLLGLTRDNEWVIVELKAGAVGGGAVEQALHYFLQIGGMTNGQLRDRIAARGLSAEAQEAAFEALATDGDDVDRDYRLIVSGIGSGESADGTADLLGRHGLTIPIQVVTFRLLRDSVGHRILLREVDEDLTAETSALGRQWSLDHVLDYAERCGVRGEFEQIRSHLLAMGYRAYRKKWGLNFNLGTRRQCFWVTPEQGAIHIGYLSSNFPALFGVDEERTKLDMGTNWLHLAPSEAVAQMRRWTSTIEAYRAELAAGETTAMDASDSVAIAAPAM